MAKKTKKQEDEILLDIFQASNNFQLAGTSRRIAFKKFSKEFLTEESWLEKFKKDKLIK